MVFCESICFDPIENMKIVTCKQMIKIVERQDKVLNSFSVKKYETKDWKS